MSDENESDLKPFADSNSLDMDIDWEQFDAWATYLLSRRNAYVHERIAIIGREYENSRRMWDAIIDREWMVMEERLKGGVGVEDGLVEQLGIDFFENREELLTEIVEMTSSLPTTTVGVGKTRRVLTIYTFEDFLMLSNQGIFRDDDFILDPQSKWKRKVAKTMADYGYTKFENLMIGGEKYYVISRT